MTDSLLPEELTAADLEASGIEDTSRALRTVRSLAGQGVSDEDLTPLIPLLLRALRASADADRALHSFARWFAAVGSPYAHLQMLRRHYVALELFCLVTGSSQVFADLLARQPECFEILANPGMRGGMKTGATFYREASAVVDACRRPELKRDALRRWKAREMLRIGVRDLALLADMPVVAREFSNLADACVQKAYDIAVAALQPVITLPFAVIGMGKLGGQELNYSSDIDLMFVHGDALPASVSTAEGQSLDALTYINRVAETLIKTLAEESANGHVFRVDMRLRPEGRFGSLTRSLSSFQAYYENWAEGWERQALLKARFIAGDRTLGETFMAMVTPYVYRRYVSAAFMREILDNKRRIEQQCALEGHTETNIKTGYGGIRDIEFIVQRLQLQWGGAQPRVRTHNTLAAIQRLHRARLLQDEQASELADDYQFLRTLEHRLQLLQGFQTQALPASADLRERARLARRMGFAEPLTFEAELSLRRNRVHGHLQRLFYGSASTPQADGGRTEPGSAWADVVELLDHIDTPAAREQIATRLAAAGFRDLPAALRALQLPIQGNEFGGMPPGTAGEFKSVAARLLDLAARSPDPDAALAGIESLALAVPNRTPLYASFHDSPEMMARLVQLAGSAPPLFKQLVRHQEWLDALVSPEDSRGEEEKTERVQRATGFGAKLDAIARLYQRERMQIGARDVWEEDDVVTTMTALSRCADAVLQVLLDICRDPLISTHADPEFARSALERVAVVGLGKLGGEELGYASDWDLVFCYDEGHDRGDRTRGQERFALVNTLVERTISAAKELAPRGAGIEIDLRLRPWGRKGALIHTLRSFIEYYRTVGETWERQAALKARYIAGCSIVGRRFVRILHAVSYGRGITSEEDALIRAMKLRIETERLKPEERETDIKLGYGGLTDIEWICQRLQLLYGPQRLSVRHPNTLRGLSALAAIGTLDNAEADALAATYGLLMRLRNAMYLQTGSSHDVIPADPGRRRALARALGYTDTQQTPAEVALWEEVQSHMLETRRIFQRRFLATN